MNLNILRYFCCFYNKEETNPILQQDNFTFSSIYKSKTNFCFFNYHPPNAEPNAPEPELAAIGSIAPKPSIPGVAAPINGVESC